MLLLLKIVSCKAAISAQQFFQIEVIRQIGLKRRDGDVAALCGRDVRCIAVSLVENLPAEKIAFLPVHIFHLLKGIDVIAAAKLREYEANGQGFQRLALLEEEKALPWNAVWDMFCLKNNVPVGEDFIAEIEKYEAEVTSKR